MNIHSRLEVVVLVTMATFSKHGCLINTSELTNDWFSADKLWYLQVSFLLPDITKTFQNACNRQKIATSK